MEMKSHYLQTVCVCLRDPGFSIVRFHSVLLMPTVAKIKLKLRGQGDSLVGKRLPLKLEPLSSGLMHQHKKQPVMHFWEAGPWSSPQASLTKLVSTTVRDPETK